MSDRSPLARLVPQVQAVERAPQAPQDRRVAPAPRGRWVQVEVLAERELQDLRVLPAEPAPQARPVQRVGPAQPVLRGQRGQQAPQAQQVGPVRQVQRVRQVPQELGRQVPQELQELQVQPDLLVRVSRILEPSPTQPLCQGIPVLIPGPSAMPMSP